MCPLLASSIACWNARSAPFPYMDDARELSAILGVVVPDTTLGLLGVTALAVLNLATFELELGVVGNSGLSTIGAGEAGSGGSGERDGEGVVGARRILASILAISASSP